MQHQLQYAEDVTLLHFRVGFRRAESSLRCAAGADNETSNKSKQAITPTRLCLNSDAKPFMTFISPFNEKLALAAGGCLQV